MYLIINIIQYLMYFAQLDLDTVIQWPGQRKRFPTLLSKVGHCDEISPVSHFARYATYGFVYWAFMVHDRFPKCLNRSGVHE